MPAGRGGNTARYERTASRATCPSSRSSQHASSISYMPPSPVSQQYDSFIFTSAPRRTPGDIIRLRMVSTMASGEFMRPNQETPDRNANTRSERRMKPQQNCAAGNDRDVVRLAHLMIEQVCTHERKREGGAERGARKRRAGGARGILASGGRQEYSSAQRDTSKIATHAGTPVQGCGTSMSQQHACGWSPDALVLTTVTDVPGTSYLEP